MKFKTNFLIILISFVLLIPDFSLADGGMIPWPPTVHLEQSAQNAIVAWNGEEEIIILSNDIESSAKATVLRMIPLPSNPSEIKEGSFDSFEKLVEIMNEKLDEMGGGYPAGLGEKNEGVAPPGIEITFHEKIGAHDVTVVKVNDLDYFLNWIKNFAQGKGLELKEISQEFKNGVANYLKSDIKYFIFDVIEPEQGKESINPLIYRFNSDCLYYPLEITAISEVGSSYGKIQLFLIVKDFAYGTLWGRHNSKWNFHGIGGPLIKYPVEFTKEEVKEVSEDIAKIFEGNVKVLKLDYYGQFIGIAEDINLFPVNLWDRNLSLGSSGEDVKNLQKLLMMSGLWESEVGTTGFFGPITKEALIKLQEKEENYILRPLGLEKGTGYFGKQTRDFLKEALVLVKKEREQKASIKWNRNLSLGSKGEDVKVLQEILIKEGVWEGPEIGATGYFGPITQAAVIKFQEKYASKILNPLGLIRGTGFVGPSSRSYLEEINQEEI